MKIVVPIKGFTGAKQRLAPVLSELERGELMKHMIDDVLSAACDAGAASPDLVSGLVVVTNDAQVSDQARSYKARVLPEPPLRPGLGNEALCAVFKMAADVLAGEGETGLLMVPADIPLITGAAICQIIASHHDNMTAQHQGVTLNPALADGGTNALILSPPQIIPPAFGHHSSERHCALAKAEGVEPLVQDIPELGLDIDTVEDLQELMTMPIRCRTQQYLLDSGIMEKIQHPGATLNGRQTG